MDDGVAKNHDVRLDRGIAFENLGMAGFPIIDRLVPILRHRRGGDQSGYNLGFGSTG